MTIYGLQLYLFIDFGSFLLLNDVKTKNNLKECICELIWPLCSLETSLKVQFFCDTTSLEEFVSQHADVIHWLTLSVCVSQWTHPVTLSGWCVQWDYSEHPVTLLSHRYNLIYSVVLGCWRWDYSGFRRRGTSYSRSLFLVSLSGLSKDTAPPEPDLPEVPTRGPPRFTPDGETPLCLSASGKKGLIKFCKVVDRYWF